MTTPDARQQAIDAIAEALRKVLGSDQRSDAAEIAEAAYGAAEPLIRADQRERDAQLADDRGATWLEPCDADDQQHSLHTHHRRPFGGLLRAQQ